MQIEIRTNYLNKNFTLRLALKERLRPRGTRKWRTPESENSGSGWIPVRAWAVFWLCVKPLRETAVYSRHALRPRVFWKYGGFVLHNRALPQCFGLRSREVSEIKKANTVPGTRKWNCFSTDSRIWPLSPVPWSMERGLWGRGSRRVTQIC